MIFLWKYITIWKWFLFLSIFNNHVVFLEIYILNILPLHMCVFVCYRVNEDMEIVVSSDEEVDSTVAQER